MANSAMTTGDFPMGRWTPLWSTPIWSAPNWFGGGPTFFPGSTGDPRGHYFDEPLPPNHDMSPAPAERYEPAPATCPHCGKPLSE